MGCAICQKKKKQGGTSPAIDTLLNISDIQVYQQGDTKELDGWDDTKHHLLLFFPETDTPVCLSELGALEEWLPKFEQENVEVFAATTDSTDQIKAWVERELPDTTFPVISSYLLPTRLGLMQADRAKRSSVFITREGEIIKQEHFFNVGRSLSELHRQINRYNTGEFCMEGQDAS